MLGDIFYWVFNMSIMASFTGLIILLLQKIKKLPRRLIFFLWAIPFIRMWMPLGLSSEYSVMNLLTKLGTKTVKVESPMMLEPEVSTFNYIKGVYSYFPMEYKTDLLEDIFMFFGIIWAGVGCLLLLGIVIAYVTTMFELRKATHFKYNIYLSEKINSPIVHGIFRQKILIPIQMENEDLTFILAHENAHIKRRDNLWRALVLVTVCIHWFNPFAWLFLKQVFANMELSCDERVLSKLGEEKAKAYASDLVDSAESKNLTASAFGGAKIHKRIDNILLYKNLSVASITFFIILASAIAYMLLTNAK